MEGELDERGGLCCCNCLADPPGSLCDEIARRAEDSLEAERVTETRDDGVAAAHGVPEIITAQQVLQDAPARAACVADEQHGRRAARCASCSSGYPLYSSGHVHHEAPIDHQAIRETGYAATGDTVAFAGRLTPNTSSQTTVPNSASAGTSTSGCVRVRHSGTTRPTNECAR